MVYPVIIRRHDGVQSYLVLDEQPRELLRHYGFAEEFEVRWWYGSLDAAEAREEWAEMLGEDPFDGSYQIIDSTNWQFQADLHLWARCRLPER